MPEVFVTSEWACQGPRLDAIYIPQKRTPDLKTSLTCLDLISSPEIRSVLPLPFC